MSLPTQHRAAQSIAHSGAALAALTACSSDESRAATSVSASTSGTVVTDSSASLPEGAWTGSAQVRDKKTGALVSELVVVIGPSVEGVADVDIDAPPGGTRSWLPAGRRSRSCIFDIQFSNAAGDVAHTDTIEFSVVRPVTVSTP